MSIKDIINCQFQLWYAHFKNITIKSIILEIPETCVDFLKSDGITIPLGYSELNVIENDQEKQVSLWMKEIDRNIKKLGGFVFPKLNWSSPKDAVWISPDKSLKCQNAEEIVFLLKSSDFITHDLIYPFDECSDKKNKDSSTVFYHLILRQWKDFTSYSELRCFIRNRNLIAISQRHTDIYVSSLDIKRESIKNDIQMFFDKHIKDNFNSDDFTFDIYRSDVEEIYLLDFNPYKASTDALLFNYEYLDTLSFNLEFRIVEKSDYLSGIQSSEFAWNAMPIDFYHLSNGLDMNKFEDFQQLQKNQTNWSDCDEDKL